MESKGTGRSQEYYLVIILLVCNLLLLAGVYHTVVNQNQQISILTENYSGLAEDLAEVQERSEAPSDIYGLVEPSVVEVRAVTQPGVPFGVGSGFVYDSNGDIITNAHVITGSNHIEVIFSDGAIYPASLVGMDVYSDLAVINVDAPQNTLKPVVLGDSSRLDVGDSVLVVGSPYGLSGSLTSGIVSQVDGVLPVVGDYQIVGVIQVDAAVNQGNSGGPLLNYFGEVVGVNSAIISRSGEFTGVGFAIPSNLVKKVVPSLIAEGVYKHPWLGISGYDVTPKIASIMDLEVMNGVLVTAVIEEGPSDKAGVVVGNETVFLQYYEINVGGDVIIGVDGHQVKDMRDLLIYLEYNTYPGETVTLSIIRSGEKLSLKVELGERPLPAS